MGLLIQIIFMPLMAFLIVYIIVCKPFLLCLYVYVYLSDTPYRSGVEFLFE